MPAFSYLYDNYAPVLFGIINRMITDRELAEDVLQESFVKIWHHLSSYDSAKGRLFTWMLNISRNLAIDTLRSKSFRNHMKIRGDENAVSNVSDNLQTAERFDALGIRKNLTLLKNDQREIIELAYFNGFTQDEIAKRLDIPLGTVKTKMRKAIIELRKVLTS